MEKIQIQRGAMSTFEKWISEGNLIGVFQNMDLGHPACGHRIFIPLSHEAAETYRDLKAKGGCPRGPDTQYGPGWRYIFQEAFSSLEPFQFVSEEGKPLGKKKPARKKGGKS